MGEEVTTTAANLEYLNFHNFKLLFAKKGMDILINDRPDKFFCGFSLRN